MKHLLTRFKSIAAVALLGTSALAARADVLLSDNFDYDLGNLYTQGSWVKLATYTDNPIQLVDGALTFKDYQDKAEGKAVVLDGNAESNSQRLQKAFSDAPVVSDKLYYAMLVSPEAIAADNSSKYVIAGFSGKNYNGWGDGIGNTSIYAVLSITPGDADDTYRFGLGAGTATPTLCNVDYKLGETQLVIVGYDFDTKDISLWINPANTAEKPAVKLDSKGTISETNGVQALCLWQGSSPMSDARVKVDAVRVATDMSDLVEYADPLPGDLPSATVSPTSLDFGTIYAGETTPAQTIDFKVDKIDGSVSVLCTSAAFHVSPTSIAAKDAMAGTSIEVTFAPTAGNDYSGIVRFMAGDAEIARVQLEGKGTAVENPGNYSIASNALHNSAYNDGDVLCLKGSSAVVTFVDKEAKCFYVQDMTGALAIGYASLAEQPAIAEGSRIAKMYAKVSGRSLSLIEPIKDENITDGTPKTPTPYTLQEIAESPSLYWNKLVAISGLSFASAGDEFDASATQASDAGGLKIGVQPFAATDVIGVTIPSEANVTGILASADGSVLRPRSLADINSAELNAPRLDITCDQLFTEIAAPINQSTLLARYMVVSANREQPANIVISGDDAAMFSTDMAEIPAADGTYEVNLYYRPTAIGAHSAALLIDAVPVEISAAYAVKAKAYDPDNLPTITIPAESLEFNAEVGATDQKSITISSANMFDYGTVKIESQSKAGTFIINNSSLVPNMESTLNITFTPLAAGSYTAVIAIEAPMAETRRINLTGEATGEAPAEEKEGTELVLDASAPVKILRENFDDAPHNKPLMLDGWCNVAAEGTRAWWGYQFQEDEAHIGAAKVTAYDSRAEEETPCEMLLVTPALDYWNGDSKLLTFSIMGDFLPENPTAGGLEVLYIEADGYMEAIGGLGIPATADLNKEWVDYVLDFTNIELAPEFFIGFRYKDTRGRSSSAVYYVDNVSWGRGDVPQICPEALYMEMTGVVNKATKSDEIEVVGLNLTEEISLKVVGANASRFTLDKATLPASGGKFTLTFNPEEVGLHSANVQLKSAGAPTVLIEVSALAKETSCIDALEGEASETMVYDLQGLPVSPSRLHPGLYIRITGNHSEKIICK